MLLTLSLDSYGYQLAVLAIFALLFIGLAGRGAQLLVRDTVRSMAIGWLFLLAAFLLSALGCWLLGD
jgi:hypothetical protein